MSTNTDRIGQADEATHHLANAAAPAFAMESFQA
jgi:hypothetical protein